MSGARRLQVGGALLLVLAVVLVALTIATVAHAAMEPASACVCPPAAAAGLWAWCKSNAAWLVPLVITMLSTLATGLSDYPKAGGIVRGLRLVASVLSLVPFKNSPGSLKAPVLPSAPPQE